ncbi:MAG TPA: hypothetical protein VGE72_04010 [Azospirillum sp.]
MDRKDARSNERIETPPEVPLPLPAVRSGRGAYVPWVALVVVVVLFALLFGSG